MADLVITPRRKLLSFREAIAAGESEWLGQVLCAVEPGHIVASYDGGETWALHDMSQESVWDALGVVVQHGRPGELVHMMSRTHGVVRVVAPTESPLYAMPAAPSLTEMVLDSLQPGPTDAHEGAVSARTIVGLPLDKDHILLGATPELLALFEEAKEYCDDLTLGGLAGIAAAPPSLDTGWWFHVPERLKPHWAAYSHETRLALFCLAYRIWDIDWKEC